VRPPEGLDLPAPEFPPDTPWLGAPFVRMDRLMGRHAVLVEFWDFARVNSLRTLPYLRAWHERYEPAGLQMIGVHSPGFSFGREAEVVTRAVERLGVPFPVALDPEFAIWRSYDNRGWPARYLFDRRGILAYFHLGEGDYDGTERAVHDALREIEPEAELPEPLAPLRPEDAPGVQLEPQTADVILPRQRERLALVRDWVDGEDWIEAADAGASAAVEFRAGGAWAVLSGGDREPGLYETDGTVVAEEAGLRLHGFQFEPLPPG
jgi:hypothetical protein